MDFFTIRERSTKNGVEIYPDFRVCRSKDLMVRAKSFYAIWNDEDGLWSTDEYQVQRIVDSKLQEYKDRVYPQPDRPIFVRYMSDFSSRSWVEFRNYMRNISDNSHQLDSKLTFANTVVTKKDYRSKRLSYPIESGGIRAYDELISTLYDPDERAKLEWAIGAIVAGDSVSIQKFIVLYGAAGSGKSTIMLIIQDLFAGYYTTFEAKSLTSSSNSFSTEVFRENPLVAIQHDGDLSKIEDNTKLNSIISHEEMTVNEKNKPQYTFKINSFLFLGTNKPVKITDAKSGIIRRLIDVRPSGRLIPFERYQMLMTQIKFELGAIAMRCLETYHRMGKGYYDPYRPLEMILSTDVFYNFVESSYYVFKEQDGVSIKQAYEMYKTYCDEALVDFKLPRHKFRDELKNYFTTFSEVARIDGKQVRSWYSGFQVEKFKSISVQEKAFMPHLELDSTTSIIDEMLRDCPAQYAKVDEFGHDVPLDYWASVKTTLSDIDTSKIHFVKVPENHIVIDFDLKDENGEKSSDLNLKAACLWPPTYAEYSKGGAGIHLHYIYESDPSELSRVYSEGVEIKVFTGNASLRRRLSYCNDLPVARINSGLPLREKKLINFDTIKSEKALRELIERNLRKEIHPGTKPSIDFINKILNEAKDSNLNYDVVDLRQRVLNFALGSTNQSSYCLNLVSKMPFASENPSDVDSGPDDIQDTRLAFFDVEVFPNLFIVCWKYEGPFCKTVRMINPKPSDIEALVHMRLVGFNCRRYDNHILYGRLMGYNNTQLFKLSQRIINHDPGAMFAEAYNISYADIYDFSSKKQTLKKWEIELRIHHQELGLPWDEPVPEDRWDDIAEYCENDVVAEEAVFNARKADFMARQILSQLSGLSINATTQNHTAQIVFGSDKNPQSKFVYTDLSEEFPGYKYEFGKSSYKDEDPGEGGYVYAEPGIYTNVALLDVASMHPTSIDRLNLFGPYTKKFTQLLEARMAIKNKDFDKAKTLLDGKLEPFLTDKEQADKLAYALKIVINIVYGLTSAKFDNKFRDIRNVDNIVAKRGALFMIDLKHEVQKRGFTVVHIKTDSIKIANATQEIIDFVSEFGKSYGYTFEHEHTFEKICLVNDAVYIAKIEGGDWTATGAQFAHPYVFKKLFTHEPIQFDDVCETRTVTTALYLDMNEALGPDEHDYHFVGRAGLFVPIKPGCGGGILLREKDGKYYSASSSKGFRWLEAEMVQLMRRQDDVDPVYHDTLVNDALDNIGRFGDTEWFLQNN